MTNPTATAPAPATKYGYIQLVTIKRAELAGYPEFLAELADEGLTENDLDGYAGYPVWVARLANNDLADAEVLTYAVATPLNSNSGYYDVINKVAFLHASGGRGQDGAYYRLSNGSSGGWGSCGTLDGWVDGHTIQECIATYFSGGQA